MKKALLATAMIAALGTAASAQGIQPVLTAPATDVTVGTMDRGTVIAFAVIGVGLAAVLNSSDGTNN